LNVDVPRMLLREYHHRAGRSRVRRQMELEQLLRRSDLPVGHTRVRGLAGVRGIQRKQLKLTYSLAMQHFGMQAVAGTPAPCSMQLQHALAIILEAALYTILVGGMSRSCCLQSPEGLPGRAAVLLELRKLRLWAVQVSCSIRSGGGEGLLPASFLFCVYERHPMPGLRTQQQLVLVWLCIALHRALQVQCQKRFPGWG
jgi:hypothetical protein